jgi:hypothetical protein
VATQPPSKKFKIDTGRTRAAGETVGTLGPLAKEATLLLLKFEGEYVKPGEFPEGITLKKKIQADTTEYLSRFRALKKAYEGLDRAMVYISTHFEGTEQENIDDLTFVLGGVSVDLTGPPPPK